MSAAGAFIRKWGVRILFAALVWTAAVILMSLEGCAPAPREPWESWPRRGVIPLAVDDCVTDSCLEYRERILAEKLGGAR